MPSERSIASLILLLAALPALSAPRLKFQGSTTVAPVVADAAEAFRAKGWTVLVDSQGGSSGGLAALAEGLADVAMISKPITDGDRRKFPGVDFRARPIGVDAVALAVSRTVYDGGVKALTVEDLRRIYEKKAARWKDFGGPDLPVVFFNKEPGRGTWEVFVSFLYGKPDAAPTVSHPEVGSNSEARNKVAGHQSAAVPLSASWILGSSSLRAVAIRLASGEVVSPTLENVRSGKYPVRRELSLVTRGAPSAEIESFLNYLAGEEGRKLLTKHGYLPSSPLP